MHVALRWFAEELKITLRRPARLLRLFDGGAWRRKLKFQRVRNLGSQAWAAEDGSLASKQFASYEDYLRLQSSKLDFIDLKGHEARFREELRKRLAAQPFLKGRTVLCLAARRGAEVRAFRDLGYFAVGIDLNPGEQNDAVCYGDFHHLPYPPGSTDVIYTNSFDHAFDLTRVLAEIRRLLHPAGVLVVEADPGTQDVKGAAPDIWATTRWATVDALKARIEREGFRLVHRERFDYPRNGELLAFARES